MKRTVLILIALLIMLPVAAQTVYTTVSLNVYGATSLNSGGTAKYTNQYGNVEPAYMDGFHWIKDQDAERCAGGDWFSSSGQYAGTLICTAAQGNCYRAYVYATTIYAPIREQYAGSGAECFGGSGPCGCDLQDEGGNCPIVINVGRGPWRLTGADDAVMFDLDADGDAERIGWTTAGASLAFLAADLNGNGVIDNGAELFGIGTLLPDGDRAANGFIALRQHDANHDDAITAADPIWASLLLWTDSNHDGQSQQGELDTLAESTVTAIELEFREVGKRDRHGNTLRYQAHCRIGSARNPFYDIFFVPVE